MAKGKSKSMKSGGFGHKAGGAGKMFGKQHAGPQKSGVSAGKSGSGGKFAKGGSGKMFGFTGSKPAKGC
jgi:hypothetical protein